jgi:hypothetical protein
MFTSYKEVDGENLYMKNSSTSNVLGIGKVILKITFNTLLNSNNVLHVADIRKNLVSSSLLSKNDFKIVFVIDKLILSKSEMFVGKRYISNDLLKINIIIIVNVTHVRRRVDHSPRS